MTEDKKLQIVLAAIPALIGRGGLDEAEIAAKAIALADEFDRLWVAKDKNVEPFTIQVSSLGVSVRLYNCLQSAGIHTIGDLCSRSERELLKIRTFGRGTLDEVRRLLRRLGNQYGTTVELGMWHDGTEN